MTTRYEIQPNWDQIQKAWDKLEFIGLNTKLAMRVGINKTSKRTRTWLSTKIRENINVLKKDVDPKLVRTMATTSHLVGKITVPSKGLVLARFGTTAKKPRVRVHPDRPIKAVRGNPAEVYPDSAFWGISPNGTRLIFAPLLTPGPKGGKLKMFYGPSPSQVFNRLKDEGETFEEVSTIFTDELIRAMRYVVVMKLPPTEE